MTKALLNMVIAFVLITLLLLGSLAPFAQDEPRNLFSVPTPTPTATQGQ
ncbi:MAG: hypothetical protein OHK0022_03680 [Roseiflexaceae bacterium]